SIPCHHEEIEAQRLWNPDAIVQLLVVTPSGPRTSRVPECTACPVRLERSCPVPTGAGPTLGMSRGSCYGGATCKKLGRSSPSSCIAGIARRTPGGPSIVEMRKRIWTRAGDDLVTLFGVGAIGRLSDAELLARFVQRQEAVSSEAAFSA